MNTNVAASERSITGETLVSEVSILIPSVNDLLLGKLARRLISFTLDATILGVDNSFLVLSNTDSNPWSTKDPSDPPALVPETDLKLAVIVVFCGVTLLNCGIISLYWIFWVALTSEPPKDLSSEKLILSWLDVLLFAFGSGPIRGFSITLSLGVIASMFTALMFTNFLVYMYLSFANKKELKL